ncbi:MAG: cysteine desulfurase family protein [Candidatus Zophobacter franzmannii]|nr:cysteine desulfurase family protein [Candidatus Zophobacter franzmannii]
MDLKRVYLDNCVTTKPSKEALDAMKIYTDEKFWFPGNFFSTGEEIASALKSFQETFSATIGAKPEEIHFTSSGTIANNIAIKGTLMANSGKGTHVIISNVDYPDILTNVAFFENSGFEVTYLECDTEGFVSADKLKAAIRPDTIMFMTSIANHVVGTIQPVKEYSEVLKTADHKIFFHADACQAYGKIPLNVDELGVNTMTISAHKIHGPQGVGALYIRKGTPVAPVIHGVKRVDVHNTGGINIAGIAGFIKAVEVAFENFDDNVAYLRKLTDYILAKVEAEITHTSINGALGERRAPHNMNISFDYIEGEAITMMLDINGITVATGSACASQGLQANYVLMAMKKTHVQSHGSIKFTVSKYNTIEEIDYTIEKLKAVVDTLRSHSPLFIEKNGK